MKARAAAKRHAGLERRMRVLRRAPMASAPVPRVAAAAFAPAGAPVLLTGAAAGWPARERWAPAALAARFPTRAWAVGADGGAPITVAAALAGGAGGAAAPAYLFDATFAEDEPSLAAEYAPPAPFPAAAEDDYLHHQTSFAALRPRYKWLLIGARGAGVGIHVDPHGTSAWNALLFGRKRWALLPPGAPLRDALRGARDAADDAAALGSAAAWFEICAPALRADAARVGLVEATQEAGEILYIPAGWWHVALCDGDANIGVTHNYLDRAGFEDQVARLAARGEAGAAAAAAWHARVVAAGLPAAPLAAAAQ